MAITYPLAFPTSFGFSTFSIGIDHAVGVTESPFTFEAQVQEHQGEAWEISGTLDLLDRAQAEEYNAFIASLRGRFGTFTVSPAGSETARGIATGTPLVNGAAQTGQELITDGWTPSQTGILLAGDFIQLGTGSTATLHRVLADVNSDGSGNATFDIAPKITTAPADNEAIVVSNPVGVFRMKTNMQTVNIKPPNIHSIRFSARQAIS
jgi:hypothetical protein